MTTDTQEPLVMDLGGFMRELAVEGLTLAATPQGRWAVIPAYTGAADFAGDTWELAASDHLRRPVTARDEAAELKAAAERVYDAALTRISVESALRFPQLNSKLLDEIHNLRRLVGTEDA